MDQLNDNELEALRLLWDKAPQKPSELQEGFGWKLDNGTLRSILVGMTDRGLIRRERQGRAFFYWPCAKRDTQLRRMAKRLAELFTGGSTEQLLMELVAKEKLSTGELAKLAKVVSEKGKSKSKR